MSKNRLFGGTKLSEIANSVKERGEATPLDRSPARPVLAAAELALQGRTPPALSRENVFMVDPKRCRPWKFHNRTEAWYTRERCADLIESIPKDGQQEPAVARRIEGDRDHDFELIYGMRRRYACEVTGTKLKVRVITADDTHAAVLMHLENADRQDITPMERAVSFQTQLDAKLFPTQESLAEALNVSKGQVAKMLKAAQLLKHPTIAALFADRSAVPVEQAYKLAAMMDRPAAKDVVLQAARNLAKREDGERSAGAVLKALLGSLDQSRKLEPLKREYNVGTAGRVVVTRNPKGKVTWAFTGGVGARDRDAVLAAVEQILKDLG
jgi:ParB family chromosome partitioning protein